MTSFFAWTFLGLQSYEIWILLIGILACSAAGMIGCFLVLRKLALMGDAISHSVLPGIALSAMFTGHLASVPVFLGAGTVGLLTPYLIDSLRQSKLLHEDASIGIVFTVLFSIGVIMVTQMGNVHIDVDCILFGEIATAPFETWYLANGQSMGPSSFWTLSVVFLMNLLFILLFYKELKLSTFDEGLAHAMGLKPRLVHYLLLGMVALTTIAAFESVGAIIVVAMLIGPGATAYLYTDRLDLMLTLSGIFGALSAILGYALAQAFGGKVSIAGCMAVCVGLLFAFAFFFSPRYGVLFRAWRRLRLAQRLAKEHVLSALYRAHEAEQEWIAEDELFHHDVMNDNRSRSMAQKLLRSGSLLWENKRLRLTPAGLQQAESLVRAHRLWEAFLEEKMGIPPDHVHRSADDMEHFITPEMMDVLENSLANPTHDPHGKPIPPKK